MNQLLKGWLIFLDLAEIVKDVLAKLQNHL